MNSNDQPIVRPSVRVILLNKLNEVLMLKADDPNTTERDGLCRTPFWFLVGGGLNSGESIEQAAIREVYEETGIKRHELTLGPLVWRGEVDLRFHGVLTRLDQHYVVAHTSSSEISFAHLEISEQAVIKEARWFSVWGLTTISEPVYPKELTQHLPAIVRKKYPEAPLTIK